MFKLQGWLIARSGASMTITHNTGKVTGVVRVYPENGKTFAETADGRQYELAAA